MLPKHTLRIATRQSPLALWQANHIREKLLAYWPTLTIELLPMLTSGDKFLKHTLAAKGGKGLFVKELEEALLDKRADIAVHSMKDVPAALPEGLCLAAICTRDNPFDALVSPKYARLQDLPKGAIVGTSSLRRQSQLLALRPDLNIGVLRGNIQTRISKLQAGDYDAILLAAAGLERMNMHALIQDRLPPEIMLPACGQGALGIECRADDEALHGYIAPLNDALSALCVQSERQVNALLGGHCHVPLAVYCEPLKNETLSLSAKVGTVDGKQIISDKRQGLAEEAISMANACVASLLSQGARALLDAVS